MAAKYSFKLLGDVRVTVRSDPEASDWRFVSTIEDVDGAVIGTGRDWTEPGAIGLAVLDARGAFGTCAGCGDLLPRGELVQDVGKRWYCDTCAYDKMIPAWAEQVEG